MSKRRTRIIVAAVTMSATAAFLTVSAPASAQGGTDISQLKITEGTQTVSVDPALSRLRTSGGKVTLSLRMADPSVSEAVGEGAKQVGAKISRAAQRDLVNSIKAKQKVLSDRVSALGGKQLTASQRAVNTIVVSIDGKQIDELAKLPGVTAISPVYDRSYDLADTVPYIGAAALHARTPGVTGAGIRVAVLDSGIDYTHARFGGAGTQAAYWAAYGTVVGDPKSTTLDGLFPTSKVIGGFDFVGESWPTGALAPDPDPIDCGPSAIAPPCAGGHGTHVASIIAGNNGVAPGASLYAFKVCSSVSTSCSGVALLQGMEAALDPNGDGDISDAVDIVNMSLGSNYGQKEDDLSFASANAVNMGVVVVASAGNGADKPYITGSPASTPEVLSVAETQVPGARAFVLRIDSPAAIAGINKNTNVVDWAPITTGFNGDVKYGATAAERLGCDPFAAGFFTGKVALIDRGTCAVSIKVDNAADAGALGVVVANNAPGAAPSFSFGGPPTFNAAQTLIVGQEIGTKIKSQLGVGVHVTVDPADATPLVGSMVATSSRGPSVSYVAIKPEIGAPGASVSANAGGGTTESAFGGTSGAAPMVSGSAALVLQVHPTYSVNEVKAVLMNTADTNIFINPSTLPGVLAEISRIGSGEVRADKAVDTKTAAWVTADDTAALSFGYVATDVNRVLTKSVRVRNYSNQSRTYNIATSFRYANDAASGAVTVSAPASITVPSTGTGNFTVTLTINANLLPQFTLEGGPNGANGATLAPNEFDGYVTLTGGGDNVHLPWHVLPHRAANVSAPDKLKLTNGAGTLTLTNPAASGQAGTAEVFALTGKSNKIPASELPDPGDNFAVVDLAAVGVREIGDVLQFGVNTHGQRSHPNAPAEFDVFLDTNQDGTDDFRVFNADLTINSAGQFDGRNVVFVQAAGSSTASAFFFIDAAMNSANAILTVPKSVLGLSTGQTFGFVVAARDNYFTGNFTDVIEGMTYQVGSPRFAVSSSTVVVPAGGSASIGVTQIPSAGDQSGLLLLVRDAEFNEEALRVLVS